MLYRCPIIRVSTHRVPQAVLGLLVLFFFWLPSWASAQAGRAYLDFGTGFKTGDFGTGITSRLYYFLPKWGYVSANYDISVAIPYLFLDNKEGGQHHAESAIGDIVLHGGRVLLAENNLGFSLHGALALKVSTADEAKGLGTGESDYGAFLSLQQRFDTLKLNLMAGYLKIGDPPALDYHDSYLYGVGIAKMMEKMSLYAALEGRRALVADTDNPLEINAGFIFSFNRHYLLKSQTFVGLNDGGPAFGFEMGLVRWF